MVTWPMTSRDPQRCCDAVRSAILATAWLLVFVGYIAYTLGLECGSVPDLSRVLFSPSAAVYQRQLSVPPFRGRSLSTSESWGVNGHTTWCTSLVSVAVRLQQMSGWGLHYRKRRSAPPYGPMDFTIYIVYNNTVSHMFRWRWRDKSSKVLEWWLSYYIFDCMDCSMLQTIAVFDCSIVCGEVLFWRTWSLDYLLYSVCVRSILYFKNSFSAYIILSLLAFRLQFINKLELSWVKTYNIRYQVLRWFV